ncbi:MAG: hypothetical protein IKP88_11895 [Lachnospiraceae bacterium]|nr:hypothetical protein [Lachnospiraceae bacterium]
MKGIGLKRGAIAASVSHDSHNLIVIGTNDEDMAFVFLTVIQHIKMTTHGLVDVRTQKILPLFI